tara:strand:+ start:1346 stop:1576 length:231 start_codon:yes stop_codon:yes gene_type:complete
MKKIITSIFILSLFCVNVYSAETKDCSEFKKTSAKYLKCKSGNVGKKLNIFAKGKKFIQKTIDYQKKAYGNAGKSD